MGDKGKQDPRESGHTIQQRETRKGTMEETKGKKTLGHTIQQREARKGTMGDKTLGKADTAQRRLINADTLSKKGYNGGVSKKGHDGSQDYLKGYAPSKKRCTFRVLQVLRAPQKMSLRHPKPCACHTKSSACFMSNSTTGSQNAISTFQTVVHVHQMLRLPHVQKRLSF